MSKVKIILAFCLLAFVSNVFFIRTAEARGDTLILKPAQEVEETIQLSLSDEVYGNISAIEGLVDFYVTSPSGIVLLWYNVTEFSRFNFTARENGLYTLHLVNALQTRNVTAVLNYCVHYKIVISENLSFSGATETMTTTIKTTPIPPLDWLDIFKPFLELVRNVLAVVFSKIIIDWFKYLYQKWKDGKSKTPVVISSIHF